MLLDTRGPQPHERLDQNREDTGQESNGYHEPIEDRPEAVCSKARLRTNTLVYILADYIQVPELKTLAVRKLADALEDDCQDDLGDVCHLVYTSTSSTSWDLRSCLANAIARRGQSLVNDAAFMRTALALPELLRDSFSCVVRQHQATSDEKDAAVRARLEAEERTNEASRKGQEDKQNVIARVNQARGCRHCSLENNVRFELERSHLGRSEYSFRCICRTKY